MEQHRLKAKDDPTQKIHLAYPCAIWRWRVGTLAMIGATLMVVMPTTAAAAAAAAHARRHRGRAWPTGAADAAFVARPSSAAVRASFRRQQQAQHVPYGHGVLVGGGGGDTGAHLHTSRGSADGVEGPCSFRGQQQQQQQQRRQGAARLPRTWAINSGSVVLLRSAAHAVDVGVNASASSEIKQSVEGEEATVIFTAAGGRPHTTRSRARISKANKGKEPWNKGVQHSEETRRKIAEGARNAALRRKEATAQSLGLTLAEYDEMKRRPNATERITVVTEATRLKISTRLKEKWKDPLYRERRKGCMPTRQGMPHTDETKARIAAAVKLRWQDPIYREKITSRVASEETRAKIGRIIRMQWADPETREQRMANMLPKTEEHRKRISEGVRSKWADPEFRRRTSEKMRAAADARVAAMGGVPKPRRERRPRAPYERRPPSERQLARSAARSTAKLDRQARVAEASLVKGRGGGSSRVVARK